VTVFLNVEIFDRTHTSPTAKAQKNSDLIPKAMHLIYLGAVVPMLNVLICTTKSNQGYRPITARYIIPNTWQIFSNTCSHPA
jgi:hypothetical protein